MISIRLSAALLALLLLNTPITLGQDYYGNEDDYEDNEYSDNIADVTLPPGVVDPVTDTPAAATRPPDPSLRLCARDNTLQGCPKTWDEAVARLVRLMTKVRLDNVLVIRDYTAVKDDFMRLRLLFAQIKKMAHFTDERVFAPSAFPIKDPSKAALLYTPENLVGGRYDDCQAAFKSGNSKTGVYLIRPRDAPYEIRGYCDNGWTVIQRRFDGAVNFFRPWRDYLAGFGNYSTEFWLGLESIYHLTQQEEYTVRIDMQGISDKWYFIVYPAFSIGAENTYYELSIGNMTVGSIDDAMTDGNGFGFSTMDRDNDGWFQNNCASHYFGAWWSSNCGSDLNRRLCKTSGHGCMEWAGIQMKKSLIRIKPSSAINPDDLLPGA